MLRNVLLATFLLAAVAGCRVKGDPQTDAASATCTAVAYACSDHADCCSYACLNGLCIANTVVGGLCRTSDDCSYTMTCVTGTCRTGFTCTPTLNDTCTSNNECCTGNCLGENTSVYPPTAGNCGAETAPTVELGGPLTIPYYKTAALTATVTDPDPEDTFVYAWNLVSGPAGNGLGAGWTSTAASPSFFPNVTGTYTFHVRVTDGPSYQRNRLFGEDTVTVYAVNLPPVVDADPVPLATTLRSLPVTLTGSVLDPNLNATPVSCTWYATPPSGSETPIPGGNWTFCPASPSVPFTPPIDGPQGDWTFRLEASDGEFVTSDVRTIQVVNAPPVAQACAGPCAVPPAGGLANLRVGNLGAPGQPAPVIPLYGSATDQNFDVGTAGFTWSWSVESVDAPGSSWAPLDPIAAGTGAAPFTASFEPDAVGTYVLRLHVDDGRGGSDDDTLVVAVDPWLRPLHPVDGGTGLPRGDLMDAAYVHATDRIVLAGYDSSSLTNRLWILDPESAATIVTPSAGLYSTAICLGVKTDGSEAIVGESGPYWQRVSLTGTPTAQAQNTFGIGFGIPSDIVYARREYATSTSGSVHELGTSSGNSSSPASCGGCTGTRAVAGQLSGSDYVWILNEGTGELRRYLSMANGSLDLNPLPAASGLSTSHDLWLSAVHDASVAEVAVGGGTIFDAAAVTSVASLPFATRHLDTTAVSTVLQGVAVSASGTDVRRLDASYASAGALPLPRIGYAGTGYPADARFAFVRSDGAAHYVIVRAYVDYAYRWYLMKY